MATGLSTVNRAIERTYFRPIDAVWAQARLCQFANLPCPARGKRFGNACGSRWWSWRLPAREGPPACLAVKISLYRAGVETCV
jgi:hypothetical protein